jgi:hypothetical protein
MFPAAGLHFKSGLGRGYFSQRAAHEASGFRKQAIAQPHDRLFRAFGVCMTAYFVRGSFVTRPAIWIGHVGS